MKFFVFFLICAAGLTNATTASAQTTTDTPPKGVTVTYCTSTHQGCPVSAELNRYEIRRCRTLGVISAADARMIRARKRAAQRLENKYLKAQAAQLRLPEVCRL